MRTRGKWREELPGVLGLLSGCVGTLTGFVAHEHIQRLEAAVILVSTVVGMMPIALYLRYRRNGWRASTLAAFCLGFSLGLALLHGWMHQVVILSFVASGAFVVALTVWGIRIHRSSEAHLRAIGAAMEGSALFRDDGERIVVYPRRTRVLIRLLAMVPAGVLFGLLLFIPLRGAFAFVLFSFGIYGSTVLLVLFASCLHRVLVYRPTLIVGPDGVSDIGSLFATGAGLIRWDEIWSVEPEYRGRTQVFLLIRVTDARAVCRRMALPKRLLRGLLAPWSLVFRIWQPLLDEPVDDLSERIRRYVEKHAPEGWFGEGDDEDEAAGAQGLPGYDAE